MLPLGSLSTEEHMKRQWQVRRGAVRRPDAQRRWDRAYQCVLRWTLKAQQVSGPSENGKEEYHASSGLRPGLDLQAGQAPDD
jgi:hypothetical protein